MISLESEDNRPDRRLSRRLRSLRWRDLNSQVFLQSIPNADDCYHTTTRGYIMLAQVHKIRSAVFLEMASWNTFGANYNLAVARLGFITRFNRVVTGE